MNDIVPVEEFKKSRKHNDGRQSSMPPDAALPPEYSEETLALAFVDQHVDELRYVAGWGKWFRFTGAVWQQDSTLAVYDMVRVLCRAAAVSCIDKKAATAIASARTVSAVEKLARSDRRIAATTDQWDADPWILNTPDGAVDLKSGKCRPARPEDYSTRITSVAPGGEWETWHRFLDRVTNGDEELQAYLRRLIGYAITGVMTDHILAFMHGAGGNGKSVFINTIAAALGEYHQATSARLFMESHHEPHLTELASLRGARLVTATEVEEGKRWKEGLIKLVTSGDRIRANFMRQDTFEFRSTAKLVFTGNHKPSMRNVDEAMRRRLHLIPFTAIIPENERDPGLSDKLKEELPGILDWAIKGCLDWQSGGLRPPHVVLAATARYFEAEDAFGTWLEDRCEKDEQSWELSTELFDSWRAWATSRGEYVGTNRRFAQNLETRGFVPHRKGWGRGYNGLKLKPNLIDHAPNDACDG